MTGSVPFGTQTTKRTSVLWIAATALAFFAYEALSYWASVAGGAASWGPVVASAPLIALICWILLRLRGALRIALVAGLIVLFACLWTRHRVPDLTLLYPVPHLLIYGFLTGMFGRTLLPGREPIITRVARLVHGPLPSDIEAYTRRVTWVWFLFFVIMAATSVLLFSFASLRVWSLFAHVLNLPLILSMFVAEYVYRLWRYPTFSHVSLLHSVRAFKRFGRAAATDGH
jgi:uncharacterized membrane protein